MEDGIIKKANNNSEREQTYRYQLGRYKRAIKDGFYYEAMMIVYSLLEDRLKSFLYYCGLFNNRNTLRLNKSIKAEITKVVYGDNIPERLPSFDKISTKILFVRGIIDWTSNIDASCIKDDIYLINLKRQIEGVDIGGLIETLDKLSNKTDGWLKYRNEIIHASMNKNIEALYAGLEERVVQGMECARYIDSQCRLLRVKGSVRKCLKLQNN